jgi:hypothetical protein
MQLVATAIRFPQFGSLTVTTLNFHLASATRTFIGID